MIVVLDDVLSEPDRKTIYDTYSNKEKSLPTVWINKEYIYHFRPLLSLAQKFIDFSSYSGFELWTHYGSKPEWHYDKDEHLHRRTGELKFPLCSILYYPFIGDNLIRGDFVTKDLKITPTTNRAIIFSPGIYHSVEEYVGERFSLILNPWTIKPESY